jgi:F-type H+-transporting ATPase subunit delta
MSEKPAKQPSIVADVSAQRIARVYAEALLLAAENAGSAESVLEELDSLLDDIFAAQPHLEVLFSGAAVGRGIRAQAIEKAFAGHASATFLHFLLVLNDHERLELLRPIRIAAHNLLDEWRQRIRVYVHSAVPLPDDIRTALVDRLRGGFRMEPIVEARLNPDLLGGMKVRVGDLQVDATLSTYLDNLTKHILSRSSHEIQIGRDRFSPAD